MRAIVVSNVTEFNQRNVRGRYTPFEWETWRQIGDELADMGAFWGGHEKVLVTPRGTDRRWLGDTADALGWSIELLEPRPMTGRLLDDALLDTTFMARLADLFAEPTTLEAWGATPSLLRFKAVLRAMGVDVRADVPRADALWSVTYLDSKLALNDLAMELADLRVPNAQTAVSFEHLLGLVRARTSGGEPFVVKSNVSVGGYAMLPILARDPSAADRVLNDLSAAMAEEPLFREGPFVLQDWVPSDPQVLRPTFDGIVRALDDVEEVGVGGMLMDQGCRYRGVVVGDVPLPQDVQLAAARTGIAVGRAAAQIGFRGWYDVDFVLSDGGDLYATEINARRTSPAHAFALLDHWRRVDATIRCVLADDHLPVESGSSWAEMRPEFDALEGLGVRCVATIVRTLDSDPPTVGVAIGAPTYDAAAAARDELADRLAGRPRLVAGRVLDAEEFN